MALRPIRPEERALIEHLLRLVKAGDKYTIPNEVQNLGSDGMGGIQFSFNGAPTTDLAEADYRDADGRDVYITLTANAQGELFDLDLWKVDFSPLQRYPTPDAVRLSA